MTDSHNPEYDYSGAVLALWRMYDRCRDAPDGGEQARWLLFYIAADCVEAIRSGHDEGDPGWFACQLWRAVRAMYAQ